ncbi:nickel ABC transporter substrate-binding protein [Vallitalea sediminicola]
MRKTITIALSLMLVFTLMLSGCSSDISQEESKGNTVTTNGIENISSNENKEYEELVIGYGVDIEGLNPINTIGNQEAALSLAYDTLVKCDNGKIKPNLAESWEISPDGKEYTFKLKKGVQFTDGTPFNAEVVKKNIELIIPNPRYVYLGIVRNFKSVEVIDEYTVKLSLTTPFYATLYDFSSYLPLSMVSPDTIESIEPTIIEGSIGTGPYIYSEYEANKYYTFVRNDNYWGEKPSYKKIVLKIIPDIDARILALKSGEIDMILGTDFLSYDAVNEIKNDDRFTAQISETVSRTRNMFVNTTSEKLGDVKIRKAIAHAINKEEIVDSLLYGLEDKSDTLFDEELPYCKVDIEPYKYDVEKANKLLDEAGWLKIEGSKFRQKDGDELNLSLTYASGFAFNKEITYAVQGYLKEVGINCEVAGSELMTWYANCMEGKFDITVFVIFEPYLCMTSMIGPYPESMVIQGLSMKSEIIGNIEKIISSNDEKQIDDSYEYVLSTLHNEVAMIPISFRKEIVIYNNDKIEEYFFAEKPQMFMLNNVK